MSRREGVVTRLVGSVRALLHDDWLGPAGQRFRRTIDNISTFARRHSICPQDIAEQGVELGRRKITGLANKEFAEALKNFAEIEQRKIDTEFSRRSLESKVRREEADARLAELQVLNAELELLKKFNELGVVVTFDEQHRMTVLPISPGFDVTRMVRDKRDQCEVPIPPMDQAQ